MKSLGTTTNVGRCRSAKRKTLHSERKQYVKRLKKAYGHTGAGKGKSFRNHGTPYMTTCGRGQRRSFGNYALCGRGKTGCFSKLAIYGHKWVRPKACATNNALCGRDQKGAFRSHALCAQGQTLSSSKHAIHAHM